MRYTLDIECYLNYFLAMFVEVESGWTVCFRMYNDQRYHDMADLWHILKSAQHITFNGNKYDLLILTLYLNGATNYEMKMANDHIIGSHLMPWDFERAYGVKIPVINHVDLIDVAFGVASLKMYGARLGTKLLQELPIHHDNLIMPTDVEVLDTYCGNDNVVTKELLEDLDGEIKLREAMSEEYDIDLRSKSDAQIAEQVIKSEYFKATGTKLKKPKAQASYKYISPSFVFFAGEQLQELHRTCTKVDFVISKKGAVTLPRKLNKVLTIGGKGYKMGIGGLHSVDDGMSYYSDDEYQIIEIDAVSYYSNVILAGGFEPVHIGELFTTIYRSILKRRIEAKKAGNTVVAESLKIVVNGLFGKFGSVYSVVYSPDLMFHTTVTGQLCLFMLIEQLAMNNVEVISANTDGILIRCHKSKRTYLDELVKWWENATSFDMEYTYYKSYHRRDVNNYIAVYDEPQKGKREKGKGIFTKVGIKKNPANAVIGDAVKALILDGTLIQEHIYACKDVRKFLAVKKVTGGAQKDGELLGATIRWYRSSETETAINYVKNGNQVGGSERGMPLMNLPDGNTIPPDLDYDWYIDEAYKVAKQLKMMES